MKLPVVKWLNFMMLPVALAWAARVLLDFDAWIAFASRNPQPHLTFWLLVEVLLINLAVQVAYGPPWRTA